VSLKDVQTAALSAWRAAPSQAVLEDGTKR
jgi:hypothetical protein